LRILAYHGVPDAGAFERQLDYLASRFRTVDGNQVGAWLRGEVVLPGNPLWITFDDGRPEVVELGATLLEARGMTATVYVCPSMVDTSRPFWWDVVEDALAHGVVRSDDVGTVDPGVLMSRLKTVDDAERRRVTDQLAERLRDIGSESRRPQLTTTLLHDWMALGFEVGNHTWDHPVLDRCSPEEQHSQVDRAHAWLTALLGVPPRTFAWPNGNRSDPAHDHLQELGYQTILRFDHRLCPRRPAGAELSRLRVDSDVGPRRLRAIVSGAHPTAYTLARRVGSRA
jgi:peptidoglycan/xylan/chitin deacetylase (PgdA/CDA1 family)